MRLMRHPRYAKEIFMLPAPDQVLFFEELLQPLKRHYKTPWCAQYFSLILQLTEKIVIANRYFQQTSLQVLHIPYRWFNLLSYFDITGGLISGTIALCVFIAIPQLQNIMILTFSAATISFAVEFTCEKLKLLAFFIESKLHLFFGQHIDSTAASDACALHDFYQTYLGKLPTPVELLDMNTAQEQYLSLKLLQNEELETTSLPAHLQCFKPELQNLWAKEINTSLQALQAQTIKELSLPSLETQQDFLKRYQHYSDYLSEHARLVAIALVTETPEPSFIMLRDKLAAFFILSCPDSDANKNIAWRSALSELIHQECAHFFGESCCDSEEYRDWVWWLQDKMNGLESAAPAKDSCPYFQGYDTTQWDNILIHNEPAIILSSSELVNACPRNGASYDK